MIEIERDDIEVIHKKIPPTTPLDTVIKIDVVIRITFGNYIKLARKYNVDFLNKKINDLATFEHNRKKKYIDYYRTLDNWCGKDFKSSAPKRVF